VTDVSVHTSTYCSSRENCRSEAFHSAAQVDQVNDAEDLFLTGSGHVS
jgi:hypothetical protein